MKIVRTKKLQKKYDEYMKKDSNSDMDHFADWQDRLIKKYKYWVIIENYFPYDNIATVSHLLITRRVVAFNWEDLIREEIEELNRIKKDIAEDYDCVLEMLPLMMSIPKHFHLHLLKIKSSLFFRDGLKVFRKYFFVEDQNCSNSFSNSARVLIRTACWRMDLGV